MIELRIVQLRNTSGIIFHYSSSTSDTFDKYLFRASHYSMTQIIKIYTKRKMYKIIFGTQIKLRIRQVRDFISWGYFSPCSSYVMITRLTKTDRQRDYRRVGNLKSRIYGAVFLVRVFLSIVKDIYDVYARNAIDRLIARSLRAQRFKSRRLARARAYFFICHPDSEAKLKRGTKSAPRPATRRIPDNAPFVSSRRRNAAMAVRLRYTRDLLRIFPGTFAIRYKIPSGNLISEIMPLGIAIWTRYVKKSSFVVGHFYKFDNSM